jgi:hypothetical protein
MYERRLRELARVEESIDSDDTEASHSADNIGQRANQEEEEDLALA